MLNKKYMFIRRVKEDHREEGVRPFRRVLEVLRDHQVEEDRRGHLMEEGPRDHL